MTKQEVSVPTQCAAEFHRLLRPEAALDRHLSAHQSGESDKKSMTPAQATKRRPGPIVSGEPERQMRPIEWPGLGRSSPRLEYLGQELRVLGMSGWRKSKEV